MTKDDIFHKVVNHCREHCEHASDQQCWIAYLTGYYAQAHYKPTTFTREIPPGGEMGISNEAVSGVFNWRDCIDTGYWPRLQLISYIQTVGVQVPAQSVDFLVMLIDPRTLAIPGRPFCGEVILLDTVTASPIDLGSGRTMLQWSARCERLIPKQSGRFWELLITTVGNIPGGEDDSAACVSVVWDEVPAVPIIPRCGGGDCV